MTTMMDRMMLMVLINKNPKQQKKSINEQLQLQASAFLNGDRFQMYRAHRDIPGTMAVPMGGARRASLWQAPLR